jgi:hypothetical protein
MIKYKIYSAIFSFGIIALSLLTNSKATAQINGNFIFSSIGSLSNTSNAISPFQFKSIAKCIDVQTGIIVLNGSIGTGQFAANCEIKTQFNSLGVKLYPNPVTAISKLKFSHTPPLSEVFSISIWSTQGIFIQKITKTGYELYQGVPMNFHTLSSGSYLLTVESSNYVDVVKFIKGY